MENGVNRISAASGQVVEASSETQKNIEALVAEVGRFKVE
jgi:hypothetical protein